MPKQDVVTEIFYDGAWHEVPVYVRDPITITNGRGEGARQATASSTGMSIDDRQQQYSPRNANSDLFGKIGRNTPLRVATGPTTDGLDAFGRTSVSGWGNADVGGAWTLVGAGGTVLASDWQVGSGQGETRVTSASAYRGAYLGALSVVDVDQVVTVTAPAATGADLEVGMMARGTTNVSYVHGRAHLATSGAVTLNIYSASGVLLGSGVVAGLTHSGSPLKMRMRTVGREIYMRVWPAADAEPAAWSLRVVDTTATPIAGWVGVRTGRATGNTNTTVPQATYDNYSVTVQDPRFYGEVASWKPRRTVDFDKDAGRGDAWVAIEAAGILRRLSKNEGPLDSAARRTIVAYDPAAYWPLEDGQYATSGSSAIIGSPDLTSIRLSGYVDPVTGNPLPPPSLPKFGAGTGPAGSGSIISLTEGGTLSATLSGEPNSVGWEVHFTLRHTPGVFGGGATIPTLLTMTTDGAVNSWDIALSGSFVYVNTNAGTLLKAYGPVSLDDGAPHHVAVWAYNDGGNTTPGVMVDDVALPIALGDATYPGETGRPRSVSINPTSAISDLLPNAFGHLAVFVPYLDTEQASAIVSAVHGHVGETAGRRIERLCSEEGVAFSSSGDLDDSVPMGPQRIETLTALLAEAERTDGGMLAEPRGWLGLTYRAKPSLENQAAALTLDFANGDIASPLDPDIDDLGIFNHVTAVSPDGASAVATKTSGTLNTSDPQDDPQGIGTAKTQHDANPANANDLINHAGWHLYQNTIDETRYPRITVYPDIAISLADSMAAVYVGDVVAVDNLEPGQVRQIVEQTVETIESHRRTIVYGGSPAAAYAAAVADGDARVPADGSSLAADITAGATSMSLASTGYLWTTDAADFPQNLLIGGAEIVTVSGIAGTSSPQTATISARAVNGVARAWLTGAGVDVVLPAVAAL